MNNEWSKPRRTCYWSMDQHSQSPPRDGANVQPIDTHCSHDCCRSGPPKRNAGSRGPSVYPNASCSAWRVAVKRSARADCAGVAMMPPTMTTVTSLARKRMCWRGMDTAAGFRCELCGRQIGRVKKRCPLPRTILSKDGSTRES
jgi:hypothetical protein